MSKKYITIHKIEVRDVGNGWVVGVLVFIFSSFISLFLPFPQSMGFIRSWFIAFFGFWVGVIFSALGLKKYRVRVEERW